MQPKKPLHEYTAAGLLFIGAQTKDVAVKSAVLAELRNRKRIAALEKDAAEHNKRERERINIELQIEGLNSKDEQERRKANRDLFAEMKERALDEVDIPEDMQPFDAIRKYNRDVYDKAKQLYTEYKKANKKTVIKERRVRVQVERKEYREKQISQKKLKQIEAETYRNARFPLVGVQVHYSEMWQENKCVGTIRGITYRAATCMFIVRLETENGRVDRALSTVEPITDAERFNDVRAPFLEFEQRERLVKKRDRLRLLVEVHQSELDKIDAEVDKYLKSEFRRDWIAADETARSFAREAKNKESKQLF